MIMSQITPGPYVIRNKSSSTVLHIKDQDIKSLSTVTLFEQNENRYRDQQIWWIEPLPGSELYSITNPSRGASLDLNPETGENGTKLFSHGRRIIAYKEHGAPWQRWKIVKNENDDNGAYYRIISGHCNGVIRKCNKDYATSAESEASSEDSQELWEFVIPIVAFPPGWLQIQSVATGDLLSHSYASCPLVLLPPATTPKSSQYRESWNTQWTFIHTQAFAPGFSGANTWCIMNRLTRTLIRDVTYLVDGELTTGLAAWEFGTNDVYGRSWKLELDSACRWKIINYETSHLLEQTDKPCNGGKGIICSSQGFKRGAGNKTWLLATPTVEERPPGYEA